MAVDETRPPRSSCTGGYGCFIVDVSCGASECPTFLNIVDRFDRRRLLFLPDRSIAPIIRQILQPHAVFEARRDGKFSRREKNLFGVR